MINNISNTHTNKAPLYPEHKESRAKEDEIQNEPQDMLSINNVIKSALNDKNFIHNVSLGMEAAHSVLCTGADIILESKLGELAKTGASIISTASIPVMLYNGIKDMKEAVKTGDTVLGTEAGGTLALAASTTISSGQFLTGLSSVAKVVGTKVAAALSHPMVGLAAKGLGVAYAGTELLTGGHHLANGIRNDNKSEILDGALSLAIGAAATAFFTIGGPATAIVLGALNLTDIIIKGTKYFSKALKNRAAIKQMARLKEENMNKFVENNKTSEISAAKNIETGKSEL